MSRDFFSLTPERVLEAVERANYQTTGVCYALNSLENRVYEVELEADEAELRQRVVAKFYRPGRWSRQTILDEHRLLLALEQAEIPVCSPIAMWDGETLATTPEGIFFALFPRVGGRSPDELQIDEYEQLGRLIARIHNVSASLGLAHRPELSPATYGRGCLDTILENAKMSAGVEHRYRAACEQLIDIAAQRFDGVERQLLHADCHRANLLRGRASGSRGNGSRGHEGGNNGGGRDAFFFLDFDDSAVGPTVQDLWLLLPARPNDCPAELDELLTGYEQFRDFDRSTLRLVEVLRGLRYIRYAAWITERWNDPAFQRAFPHYGTDNYWEAQTSDVNEQLRLLLSEQQMVPAW
jgi:Ser/Thr protein kinase RdoA (MazF antagonist)